MPADRPEDRDVPRPAARRLQMAGLVAGPLVAGAVLLAPPPGGMEAPAWAMVAVAAWMVLWWLTEALPLPATALLPLVLMPLLDLRDIAGTAQRYANPLVFLFLGGFLIAAALQRVGLHRRIALNLVALMGAEPGRIVLGFMLATAFLSMWISNTATAILMFAVALPVIAEVGRNAPEAEQPFGVALMLAIAYAASIGGVATLIGTPPNALLAGFLAETTGRRIGFGQWMLIGLPVTAVMLPVAWLWLTRLAHPLGRLSLDAAGASIRAERAALAPMDKAERFVALVFAATATGWILRAPLEAATGLALDDAMIAIAGALVLFAVPVLTADGRRPLDWAATVDLPWGILLLFGGGLALADGFGASGLAASIGAAVGGIAVPVPLLVLAVLVAIVFLTEVTSNTASTATFLPILAAVALGLGLDPLVLTVPVAMGASMAFMMPVATPPNAIVFAYEGLDLRDMVRAGVAMNILAVAVIYATLATIAPIVFALAD